MNLIKTTLAVIIISCSFIYNSTAQTTRTVKQDETLKGRVMQLSQTDTPIKKEGTVPAVKDTLFRFITKFDKAGSTSRVTAYIKNSINMYSDKKTLDTTITTYTHHRDARGILTRSDVEQGPGEQMRSVISYDGGGNIRQDSILSAELKTLYKSDETNRLSEITMLDRKGNVNIIVKYNYDQRGNESKTTNFNTTGKLNSTTYFIYKTYDTKGNWTKRTVQTDYKNGTSSPGSIQERAYVYYK
ncbi:hypothetical protein HQ865_16230 [Mucilaginibacter mali]|uniref:YD repeat-containing protein n=1 Tax=Mucilaginibacter mali TaxID=2740462 RepID=A0A7D4UBW0_9SPHI|nr:hypothetical protein [Mucilaginibacter mali]QKJ31238.1 hypothetical protein HQ865_16230 [Mucilaginibacter mali]